MQNRTSGPFQTWRGPVFLPAPFSFRWRWRGMVIVTRYTIGREADTKTYYIRSREAPLCPVCGTLLSGYDRRARHVIGASSKVYWFSLRRLRCPCCKRLHLEIPDFMRPKKHYEASVIDDVMAGRLDTCPADAATMRRWRRESHPPSLPSPSDVAIVSCTYIDGGEADS